MHTIPKIQLNFGDLSHFLLICIPSFSLLGNERIMNIESMYVNHWREVCHVVQLSSHSIERICCSGPADSDSEKTLSMLKRLKALSIVLPEDIFPVSFLHFLVLILPFMLIIGLT